MLTRSHNREVWGKVTGDDISHLLAHVADMLCQGKSNDAIHTYLISQGKTEAEAYFIYCGAVILAGDRVSQRVRKAS